ncbi:MAG: beta-lactamase family protein [Sphingobacterium sp.]|nr:beta-lactamase family protein [Sphingobacterium sp.]
MTGATKHCLSSVTKSVTATLLGIAIDRGFVPSVDERVLGYFPEMADLDVGLKSAITLKHLVTMSAGLQWDEWSYPLSDPRNDLTQWFRFTGDLVRFVLERPMVADPGALFTYNGGLTNVLGEAIRAGQRPSPRRLLRRLICSRLSVSPISLGTSSVPISCTPRATSACGRGTWPSSAASTSGEACGTERGSSRRSGSRLSAAPVFSMQPWPGFAGYSYGWWPKTGIYGAGAFAAEGWGGQALIVMPEFDALVVLTGGSYWESPLLSPHQMMEAYILPALR